jgi:hypothetical protein
MGLHHAAADANGAEWLLVRWETGIRPDDDSPGRLVARASACWI